MRELVSGIGKFVAGFRGVGIGVCTHTIVNSTTVWITVLAAYMTTLRHTFAANMGHHFTAVFLFILFSWDTILLVSSFVYGWYWVFGLILLLKSITLPQTLCVQVSRLVTYALGLEIGTRLSTLSKRPVIYSGHPHNIMPLQCAWYHSHRVRIAVDPTMRTLIMPLCATMICNTSARRDSFTDALLKAEHGIWISPGGADEMILNAPVPGGTLGDPIELYLHRGIFRVAMRCQALVVPSLCFDELRCYRRIPSSASQWLWDRYKFPFVPHTGAFGWVPVIPFIAKGGNRLRIDQSPKGVDPLHFTSAIEMCIAYKAEVERMAAVRGIHIVWKP